MVPPSRSTLQSWRGNGRKDLVKDLQDNNIYLVNEKYWLEFSDRYIFDDTHVYMMKNHLLAHFTLQFTEVKNELHHFIAIP